MPPNAVVDIYTDSQNCIDTYKKFLINRSLSIRQQQKINSFSVWKLIAITISYKSLVGNLHKVAAHSNLAFNDQTDALAKAGARDSSPILINTKFFGDRIANISWNGISHIDKDVRKWSKNPIQARQFNWFATAHSLWPLTYLTGHNAIDWDATQRWINYNPTDTPTSTKRFRILAHRIKACTFKRLTLDCMQRNYLDLYPRNTNLPCPSCHKHPGSNAHIALCATHQLTLSTILSDFKSCLINILSENCTIGWSSDIPRYVNNSTLFKPMYNPTSNNNFYHILHCSWSTILFLMNFPVSSTYSSNWQKLEMPFWYLSWMIYLPVFINAFGYNMQMLSNNLNWLSISPKDQRFITEETSNAHVIVH